MLPEDTSSANFEFHEEPTQPAIMRPPRPTGDGALVLIIDDDDDAIRMYAASLQYFGYRTAGASNGVDGVRTAANIQPAVILMDAAMPGMGGIEAMRRIKADPRTQACPVIVITASGTALFEEARSAGCAAYFCKPFNLFALHTVIELVQTPTATVPTGLDSAMVKECSCGQVYSLQSWLALPLCGRMFAADSAKTTVELRNCSCGSTLAQPVHTS